MSEVLFYHLERRPLEAVLPALLEKCLERGWRAVVECGSQERMAALDSHLWTWREDSFLPHGTPEDGDGALQPVYLTTGGENPNGAACRFLVDGAPLAGIDGYERVVLMFDGRDEEAVAAARAQWTAARDGGAEVTYWQQDETGRWVKKG